MPDESVLLHAAGVSRDHRGLVLAGASGTGKSTLALKLAAAGFDFLSSDRLILDPARRGPVLTGVPKHPRVNPGTLMNVDCLASLLSERRRSELQTVSAEALWNLEEKHDVNIARQFGPGRHVLRARLAGTLVLNWRRQGTPANLRRVDIASRPDLWEIILKTPGVFASGPARWTPSPAECRACVSALGCAPVCEISGGVDFDVAQDACQAFMDQTCRSDCCLA